jgi:hypothetical protein
MDFLASFSQRATFQLQFQLAATPGGGCRELIRLEPITIHLRRLTFLQT